jgi:hypothetical protein
VPPTTGTPEKTPVPTKNPATEPTVADPKGADEKGKLATEPAHPTPTRPVATPRPRPTRVTIPRAPAPVATGNFGYLRVNSKPWTKIIVDGVDTGLNTPQTSYRLTPGTHKLTLFNPQFNIKETFTITLSAGETQTVIKDFLR